MIITAFNESKSLKEWLSDSRCNVEYSVLYQRIFICGWDIEKALCKPKGSRKTGILLADSKFCPACSTFKPRSSFYKNNTSKHGLQAYCKKCCTEYNKKNPDSSTKLLR